MATSPEPPVKFITVCQAVAQLVKHHLERELALPVEDLGFTDSSSTKRTLRLETRLDLVDIEETVWEVAGWVHATLEDPRRGSDDYVSSIYE